MSRIIILSFDSNEAAEGFARTALSDDQPYKLEAMIARPTRGCPGPHRVPGRMKSERGWTRTKRFGWWVCSTCKRPSSFVVRDFIDNMIGGYNDLLSELTGGQPRPPRRPRAY